MSTWKSIEFRRPDRMILVVALLVATTSAHAQFAFPQAQQGQQLTQHWQVGVVVTAQGGPVGGLYGTIPVPKDWDEQQVKIVNEEFTNQIGVVKYRDIAGVRQMRFTVPFLIAGDQATALVTFEVTRTPLKAPSETGNLLIPKKLPRDVRTHLGAGPQIETRNPAFRLKLNEIVNESQPAWQQVESIYDWVREDVKYQNGRNQGALAAIRKGSGTKDDLTAVFVALCRVHKVPARMVFIPDHCYAEFYLCDSDHSGQWYPCMVAGARDFGAMPDLRPILQKGDNFRIPEEKEPQRFVAEFLTGSGGRGSGTPEVEFVRKLLPAQ